MNPDANKLRIDRWLFFCRFFKTRSLATQAVRGGHVRRNGERASPGVAVQAGDRLEVTKERMTWVLTVVAIPARRGPAKEAAACYEEDPASIRAREEQQAALKSDRMLMPRTDGRPDKRTRRQLIRRHRG